MSPAAPRKTRADRCRPTGGGAGPLETSRRTRGHRGDQEGTTARRDPLLKSRPPHATRCVIHPTGCAATTTRSTKVVWRPSMTTISTSTKGQVLAHTGRCPVTTTGSPRCPITPRANTEAPAPTAALPPPTQPPQPGGKGHGGTMSPSRLLTQILPALGATRDPLGTHSVQVSGMTCSAP